MTSGNGDVILGHLCEKARIVDTLDKQLLNIIQTVFSIESRPYRILAHEFGCTEDEILARVSRLIDEGIIRRIGPTFDPGKLGYTSVLVAAKVPPERLDSVAELVRALPSVTHNYSREGDYNLWFTMICASFEEAFFTVEELKASTGVDEMYILPAERVFKIKVDFEF